MRQIYNKLVRDRIPEIIEESGRCCVVEVLSDADYIHMLNEKLNEELAEYQKDQSLEELADLLEVIRAVVIARGYSIDELEKIRIEKAQQRGGFERKLLLKYVEE
jgi:predicted house-cleaning noncanonical NTP pyrophosphatase (MazG superfamily)